MFKKSLSTLAVGILFTMAFCPVHAYEAFQGPTELIQYDAAKAYNGYTLFSPFRAKNSYLIDMSGNVVHMWPYPEGWSSPGQEAVEKHARLLEDGTLLRGTIDRSKGGRGASYQILDWGGVVKWQFKDPREGYSAHHDFRMIWNPKLRANTLMYVASKSVTHEQAIALGCDPNLRSNYRSAPDGIVEVDMNGNIVWEWNISDHLIQDINQDLPNYGVVKDHPEKLDPNFAGGRRGDWIHTNSFDYNEMLDQVVINNSTNSEFYVVDHGGTFIPGDPEGSIALAAGPKGDFLFRWGNPCVYDSGDCPSVSTEGTSSDNGHTQVFFTHDIQWIREKEIRSGWKLPGSGHFLIFDNGSRRLGQVYSSILEIDPYDGPMENGNYIPEVKAGYASRSERGGKRGGQPPKVSNQVVWSFKSTSPNAFYGNYISGCQRLPNGNTLIDSGPHGHFFEVTEGGEVVWEYINPVGDRTQGDYGIYELMNDRSGTRFNSVFRCARYGPDYPGLAGKDLIPKGLITQIHTDEPKAPPRGAAKGGEKGSKGGKGGKGGKGKGGKK